MLHSPRGQLLSAFVVARRVVGWPFGFPLPHHSACYSSINDKCYLYIESNHGPDVVFFSKTLRAACVIYLRCVLEHGACLSQKFITRICSSLRDAACKKNAIRDISFSDEVLRYYAAQTISKSLPMSTDLAFIYTNGGLGRLLSLLYSQDSLVEFSNGISNVSWEIATCYCGSGNYVERLFIIRGAASIIITAGSGVSAAYIAYVFATRRNYLFEIITRGQFRQTLASAHGFHHVGFFPKQKSSGGSVEVIDAFYHHSPECELLDSFEPKNFVLGTLHYGLVGVAGIEGYRCLCV